MRDENFDHSKQFDGYFEMAEKQWGCLMYSEETRHMMMTLSQGKLVGFIL